MAKYKNETIYKATKVINDCKRIMRIYSGMYYKTTINKEQHKYWAGKGITICEEWLEEPLKFYMWSIENGYQEGLTIDRIDSNGNYEPNNCQWVTKSENSKRVHGDTRYITYQGKKYLMNEIEKTFGINPSTVIGRLKRGWELEKALKEPPKKMGRKYSKSYAEKTSY